MRVPVLPTTPAVVFLFIVTAYPGMSRKSAVREHAWRGADLGKHTEDDPGSGSSPTTAAMRLVRASTTAGMATAECIERRRRPSSY
jgi:hypothetical protein